ncbi:MAG: pyridoxal-phosphate dependent enzyme [Anaerolineae bacterium]|nr:pyridoxal-phosphate dependent enzyme [Anaerolineae bacterium]
MATQPDARAALDRLPRVTLAQLPTPFEPLPNLTRALGGPALFIKRDDQTGLATGGNKTRKLEFLVAEALGAGADTLITAGSTQSNHARQTAAAAARRGLACHLVLYAPDGIAPREITGNLLIDHLLGATIHWTEERAPYTATLARVEAEVRAAGGRPHLIPYGGSNALGAIAYAGAFLEMADQTAAGPDSGAPFDAIVFATSPADAGRAAARRADRRAGRGDGAARGQRGPAARRVRAARRGSAARRCGAAGR